MGLEVPGYKILRTLGRGGMATVYLAEQEIFEREVALKVMSKALAADESFGKRFFREAKIVSQLVHPNIVTVHDVGVYEGNYYLSMEHIDGSDLKQVRHSLSLRKKIRAVLDIAKALEYAGSKGYVHRDIKPENIMFHKSDGRAVLTDFGIARAAETDTSMTQTGTAIGTPHYMSPEQAKGKPVDPRSDIYSLGVVFFLLLTGHVPFDAESAVAIGIKHITEPVPLLPEGLDALQPIIDTLLAKKLDIRYQTASEFIEDMERIDIRLLEQTLQYAREEQAEGLDTESPTQQSEAVADNDLALVYDDQDTIINERSGFFSWFVGFLIVGSLAGWVLYYQKPEMVTPWLQQGKIIVEQGYDKALQWMESLSAKPESATGVLPSESVGEPDQVAEKKSLKIERRDGRSEGHREQAEPSPAAVAVPTASSKITSPKTIAKEDPKPVRPTLGPAPPIRNHPVSVKKKPITPLVDYQQRLLSLQAAYENDAAFLPDLVDLHRTMMREYPKHLQTHQSLRELRQRELAAVSQMISNGMAERALVKLQQLQAVFPEVKRNRYVRLREQAQKAIELERWLSKGQSQMAQRRLTQPRQDNALLSFGEALKLSPGNHEAVEGIKKIAREIVKIARNDLNGGRFESALQKARKASAIDSTSREAQDLIAQAQAAIDYRQEMARLFELAEQRMNSSRYFTPTQDNAFYYYEMVLMRETENSRAKAGQKKLVDAFARNIWTLVGNEEFSRARKELAAALNHLPRNQRLQSLSLAVEEVVADKISAQ